MEHKIAFHKVRKDGNTQTGMLSLQHGKEANIVQLDEDGGSIGLNIAPGVWAVIESPDCVNVQLSYGAKPKE